MTIHQDDLLGHVRAGAIWAHGMGHQVLCARDSNGVWRSVIDVTEECRTAQDAGLIRFDGLGWHLTDAGTRHLANAGPGPHAAAPDGADPRQVNTDD
jgi:hypothetical protein